MILYIIKELLGKKIRCQGSKSGFYKTSGADSPITVEGVQ